MAGILAAKACSRLESLLLINQSHAYVTAILARSAVLLLTAGLSFLCLSQYACCQRKILISLIAALLCAGGFFVSISEMKDPLLESVSGEEKELEELKGEYIAGYASIEEISEKENGFQIRIKSLGFDEPAGGQIKKTLPFQVDKFYLLTEEGEWLRPGMTIHYEGSFQSYPSAANPGEFDQKAYYKSLGILGKIQVKKGQIRIVKEAGFVSLHLYELRLFVKKRLTLLAQKEDQGILYCLLTGDKSLLEDDLLTLYRDGGLLHLLTLSGLHISLIGTGLFFFFRVVTKSMAVGSVLSFLSVLLFAGMCVDGASTVRAVICYLLAIIARMIGKQADLANSACAAMLLLLIGHPLLLFQSGFLMMFSCLMGIAYLMPMVSRIFTEDRANSHMISSVTRKGGYEKSPVSKLIQKGKEQIPGLEKAILSAVWMQIFMMPALVYFQWEVRLSSFLINLMTLPLLGLVLLSGVLALALSLLFLPLGAAFLGPAHYILAWFRFLLGQVTAEDFFHLTVGRPGLRQLSFAIVSGFFLLQILYQKLLWDHRKSPFFYGILALPLCLLLLTPLPGRNLEITFLDVGQGDGIVVRLPQSRKVICIDGGSSSKQKLGKYLYEPYLRQEGIGEIECLILTHPDADHYSAALELLESGYPVKHLFLAECFKESELAERIKRVHEIEYLEKGDLIKMGDLSFYCLSPQAEEVYADENDASLVLHLSYGEFCALFTGDISENVEKKIVRDMGKTGICQGNTDLLKLSHHGSSTASSQEFLEKQKPGLALISAGKDNPYGHPHQEVLRRLQALKIPYLNTAKSGCIRIYSDGRGFTYRTFGE